jgi:predicted short-subunit dehydrogenase-like oxidoreductase (DUF2520 family)
VKDHGKNSPTITFIGAGALAAGLGGALHAKGYTIDEIVVRRKSARKLALAAELGARLVTAPQASFASDITWLAVPDDAIGSCAASLAIAREWRGTIVLHSSGALSSDVLAPLRKRGAAVASMHPMMTFVRATSAASPATSASNALAGVCFAVEGDARAVRVASAIARNLGGEVLKLDPSRKVLYHAYGAFLSPLLIAELTAAEEVARAAGISKAHAQRIMRPIVKRTVDNYIANGAQKAFSGPLVRGDVETIKRHLASLHGEPLEVYVALARLAIRKLKVKNARKMKQLLG